MLLAAGLAAAWISHADAGALLDQSNEGPSSGGVNIVTNAPLGQEFVPTQTMLTAVELHIGGNFGISGICAVTAEIREATIDGTIFKSTLTIVDQGSPPAWRHFAFIPNIALTPGSTYVIAVSSTSDSCGASRSTGDLYPAGAAISSGVVSPGADLLFRTFGFTPATPTPTPSPTPVPGQDVIWGDNNCSGAADPVDALLTLRFDAGLTADTGDCPEMGETVDVVSASLHVWGDADCSGDAGPADALKLLRYDAGLDVSQAEGCPAIGSAVTVSAPATPTPVPTPTPSVTPSATPTPSPSPTASPAPCTMGVDCCVGTDACTGFTGKVGVGSCIGIRACYQASGDVKENSCTGEEACHRNSGDIGNNSCKSNESCMDNEGTIGDGSCDDSWSCRRNTGSVGDGSCLGPVACYRNSGNIGDGKCIFFSACNGNTQDKP